MKKYCYLKITLSNYVHEFPGYVDYSFTDSDGITHTFTEKVPVLTINNITAETVLPVEDKVPVKIISELEDRIKVDLASPYGLMTDRETWKTIFDVPRTGIISMSDKEMKEFGNIRSHYENT
ncbi:MAG TPA: hypothetical protein VL401_00095 [Alphaproteobacteria bacterium]|jgi:hypothetical protein|nr:hypothetical protein [Alphaproteobacteria bacterium]